MRSFLWLGLGVLVLCLAARGNSSPGAKLAAGIWPNFGAVHDSSPGAIDVVGQTQRAPGRKKHLVTTPGAPDAREIEELPELHVRCDVTRAQADALALGQPVEMRLAENNQPLSSGRLICIAPVSDPRTGRVMVLVRLQNRDRKMSSGLPVSLHFAVDPSLAD